MLKFDRLPRKVKGLERLPRSGLVQQVITRHARILKYVTSTNIVICRQMFSHILIQLMLYQWPLMAGFCRL